MPDLIPTEQVRADEIKEGDVVLIAASGAIFKEVREIMGGAGDHGRLFRYKQGGDHYVLADTLVLRQAAPASLENDEQGDE